MIRRSRDVHGNPPEAATFMSIIVSILRARRLPDCSWSAKVDGISIWFLTHVQELEHGTLRLGGPPGQGHWQGLYPSRYRWPLSGRDGHRRQELALSLLLAERAQADVAGHLSGGVAARGTRPARRSACPGGQGHQPSHPPQAETRRGQARRRKHLRGDLREVVGPSRTRPQEGRQTTLSILPRVFAKDVL